ncbi:Uncharacterised protein [Enterobacter hormaechei]|nr:Uncharacterised protein [Enterobacter hormaechei]CZU84448.1 Uncharacterised protein [Enterobacter hormaechei]CZW26337.1 Uncharacterised protein [Enterobacter hormaechei]CZZ56701.1 Uncharacterised protein [Enterobacter hormaechei]CZZ72710.1 Uncharacterised protein [Enterobacter hormaechei]
MLQRQANAVQTVQHAVATERINAEAVGLVTGFHHFRFQIHFKRNPRICLHQRKQFIDLFVTQRHRQQLVVEAVAVEDIREAWGDNHLKAVVGQCPWRMFTRRSAAKVFPRQQNGGAFVFRKVQDEFRVRHFAFIVEETPVVEQMRTKTRARHFLQKLLRNDRVGIDVSGVQRDNPARMLGKFLCHDCLLISGCEYRRNDR